MDTASNAGLRASDHSVYAVLGVRPDAPAEVVEAAYKALAKKYHPDRGGSLETMRQLNWARDQIRRTAVKR
jgi:curved DNA-binding protein CbpA